MQYSAHCSCHQVVTIFRLFALFVYYQLAILVAFTATAVVIGGKLSGQIRLAQCFTKSISTTWYHRIGVW